MEDLFAKGARLDPVILGQTDNRPLILNSVSQVGFLDGHMERMGELRSGAASFPSGAAMVIVP